MLHSPSVASVGCFFLGKFTFENKIKSPGFVLLVTKGTNDEPIITFSIWPGI